MKKLVLALVVALVATPALAKVTIEAKHLGDGIVAIDYDATTESELVRAFALDITVTAGVIEDINDYAVGDDNGGYGIFPANFSRYITVDPQTGDVQDWAVQGYTPVADPNDPGALGGLGTSGITIELGSLYDTNAPAKSGRLCTIKVSENCEVQLALNQMRGNVVLESAAEPAEVELIGTTVALDCFPASNSTYNDWVALGKPDCWCNPYQCDGDVNNDTETFFKYRVYISDLNTLVDNWKKKINDPTLNPCADIDHKPETFFKYRVYINDLNRVVANWKKKDSALPGDCPRAE